MIFDKLALLARSLRFLHNSWLLLTQSQDFCILGGHKPPTMNDPQLANLIATVSALATLGMFWYAFYLERQNSKKINDLAEITKKLSEQNALIANQVRVQRISASQALKRNIQFKNVYLRDNTNGSNVYTIEIVLTNKGEKAIVTNYTITSADLTFNSFGAERAFHKDTEIYFHASNGNKGLLELSNWKIELEYLDGLGNKYISRISGNSTKQDEITTDVIYI